MSETAEETKGYNRAYREKNKAALVKKRAELYQIQKNREYLTRPASAVYLGLTTQKLYNIINFKKYWNVPEHLNENGIVRYHKKDLDNWRLHNPQYFDGWALIKKGYYTMSANVMEATAWLQASKHVTDYCNKQRVAINSNNLWARWA
jgi:hypothetical protein